MTYRGDGPIEDQRTEARGLAVGGEDADHRAHGVSDEDDIVDIEGLEDLQEIVGVSVERVVLPAAVGRPVGASGSHVVEQDDLEVGLERRCDRTPRRLTASESVREDHGRGRRGCPSP